MTIAEALRAAAAQLTPISDTARLDAELLMAHCLGLGRSDMLLRHGGDQVPDGFAELIRRRAAHEPVAYIAGVQEFYGREFAVNPAVLIPRADSESVVEAALGVMPPDARVLDLGTGSGALLLTLLAERGDAQGIGIDNSAPALAVAQHNGAALGLECRAQFLCRSWHDTGWADDLGLFDLIISNPPYVERGAQLAPSVVEFEPHTALFAGPDGLDDYTALIPQLRPLLQPEGQTVLEIGAAQADAVSQIADVNGFTWALFHDLAHRPRGLLLR